MTALEQRPNVHAASVATAMPFDLNIVRVRVTSVESHENNDSGLSTDIVAIGHRYFDAMGIPISSGRAFNVHDDEASERVTIVNEALASKLWPDGAAVGRSLHFGDNGYRVVGTVPTGKYLSLSESNKPWLFVPFRETSSSAATLVLRHRDGETAALAELRRTLAKLNPEIPPYNDKTMSEQLSVPLFPSHVGWYSMASFGLVALLLSGIALYETMSYWAALREKEIGVRRALGAGAKDVTRLLLREVSVSLFAGAVVFMIAAALVQRAIHSLLVTGVASEWLVHTVVLVVVFGGTMTASSLLAARRALRIDPARALAAER